MKYVVFIGILAIALFVGIQNHGSSLTIPELAAARDANCKFLNDDNRTSRRNGHLNSYNVCVTADYMERVVDKRPYPQSKIVDSIERRNLIEKLLRFNDPNKTSYVTLLSNNGLPIVSYTIKGKVSSNQSSLTSNLQCDGSGRGVDSGACIVSPSDDGSYGENEAGIFFFDTSGVLHQWNGLFLLSDAPQQITTAPVITYNVSDKPSSAIDIGR